LKNTPISFRIIPTSEILTILPFLNILNSYSIAEDILKNRVLEMAQQNYECIGIYDLDNLIGVCGMWFQTRHYAGKNIEIDHLIISENYRDKGIGKKLMNFITAYAKEKNCNWIELNSYVHNFPSHKFFYNEGFVAKGYHFVKEIN